MEKEEESKPSRSSRGDGCQNSRARATQDDSLTWMQGISSAAITAEACRRQEALGQGSAESIRRGSDGCAKGAAAARDFNSWLSCLVARFLIALLVACIAWKESWSFLV